MRQNDSTRDTPPSWVANPQAVSDKVAHSFGFNQLSWEIDWPKSTLY